MPAKTKTADSPRASSPSLQGTTLGLIVLLAVFLMIAALWAVFIPIPATSPDAATWDGYNPDEHVHLRFIEYMASHHALPPYGNDAPASYLTHPPLYYALGAVIYTLLAPAVGYGGMFLVFRFVGALFGAGIVYLTYRIARLLLPERVSLLAAICAAGVPMFVSLSASVSNEVPNAFCVNLAMYQIVAGLRYGFDRRRVVLLALWLAIGIGVKVTSVPLLPVALLAMFLRRRAERQKAELHRRVGMPFLPASLLVSGASVLMDGWWFVRNTLLYGDPVMSRVHEQLWLARGATPWNRIMTPVQFAWNGTFMGWMSFWGVFDAFTRPMPDAAYYLILGIQIPAIIGVIIFAVRGGLRRSLVRRNAAVCLALFSALIWLVFHLSNLNIYVPQGRYLFPLLAPLGIATALGWAALVGKRFRIGGIVLVAAALLLLNFAAFALMSARPDKSQKQTSVQAPANRSLDGQ